MKNAVFAIVALAVVAWSAGLIRPGSGETSGKVPFVDGIDTGLDSARGESRAAMLYFTADW